MVISLVWYRYDELAKMVANINAQEILWLIRPRKVVVVMTIDQICQFNS